MVKHFLIFALLILISAGQAFSQTVEQQVGKIREIYAATNKRIADGFNDNTQGLHYAVWRIGGKDDGMQWSAAGTMETIDEIWFDGGDDGAEEDGAKAVVYKIVSTYKSGGVLHSRSEYYFDEAGKLIFILAGDDAGTESGRITERRFYYTGGKLVRITLGGKNTDKNFTAGDLDKSDEESRNAREMQNRYAAFLSEQKPEK